MKTLRCVLAFPFGLLAEGFSYVTLLVSGGELNINFNYLRKK